MRASYTEGVGGPWRARSTPGGITLRTANYPAALSTPRDLFIRPPSGRTAGSRSTP